ncbi:MAG: 4-alpha-glucanotransferase [Acidobacteriota bacterium]|nr:4-alpha-glucanotransferase [Acidobacteriota bacterium]
MPFERASGILLHPTSLPSAGGIGDLGPEAHRFADFLGAAKQGIWQVLPLGPCGAGNSPYSATSAFAGNPLLISLERLAERGWIAGERLAGLAVETRGAGNVDFQRVSTSKRPLLHEAARNFVRGGGDAARARFERFQQANAWWLDDFALFDVLRERNQQRTWRTWPRELARREPLAIARSRHDFADDIAVSKAMQFAFFEQWAALRAHCRTHGIKIVGDVAIFVSYDSADVWMHPELFELNEELEPTHVAGVPPDFFSKTGQRWGNPLYRWEALRASGYDWWVRRLRWALASSDIIRLDHFRGFEAYWQIPAAEKTAVNGSWIAGPRDELFHALREQLGDLPFIAEDLGFITPEVHQMRARLGIPGMRVMEFGFGDPGAHIYLPHRFERNTVVYTGTHDNATIRDWWEHYATPGARAAARAYLGEHADGVHWAFIRAAADSVADLCIVPLGDVLGLGAEGRMNVPSEADGNWAWRFRRDDLTPELAQKLAELATVCDRAPLPAAQERDGEAREEFAA